MITVICALLLLPVGGHAAWRVSLDGTDMTAPAAPIERGANMPAVNVIALAPALGIAASVQENTLRLVDTTGTEWQAENGALSLDASGKSLPLTSPTLVQGSIAYLSVDTLAETAGKTLTIDPTLKIAAFSSSRQDKEAIDFSDLSDWEGFTVEKSAKEKKDTLFDLKSKLSGNYSPDAFYRPFTDNMQFGVGLGYVQDGGWGADLTAQGVYQGVKTQFGSTITTGLHGLCLRNPLFSLRDEDNGWNLEAGNLFSDVFGTVAGARYGLRVGKLALGKEHWPSLACYFPGNDSADQVVLAIRDEVQLTDKLKLGGEAVTDHSVFLKGEYKQPKLFLAGYHRSMKEGDEKSNGVFATYALTKKLALSGGISQADGIDGNTDWHNLSMSYSLTPNTTLILEHTQTTSAANKNTAEAVMLLFPVGPVRLLARYQWGDTARFQEGPQLGWIGFNNRSLLASTTYFASSRLSFDYQVTTHWQDNGSQDTWRQLVGNYRVSPRTQLQVISDFPHFTEPDRLRLRVKRDLGDNYALTLDYGRLAPFQNNSVEPGALGFSIMLRKSWEVKRPARGGEISGQVTDQAGRPVAQAIIRLDKYYIKTDTDGRYAITSVKPGAYHISLDEKSLPANYAPNNGHRILTITSDSREVVNFRAIPLNSITGRVYLDKDQNGRYDAGEGVGYIVVRLNGFSTVTNDNGQFGFYNMAPGPHTMKLDLTRLKEGFAPDSPEEMTVDLPVDKPITGVEFRLKNVEKPIIFQTD